MCDRKYELQRGDWKRKPSTRKRVFGTHLMLSTCSAMGRSCLHLSACCVRCLITWASHIVLLLLLRLRNWTSLLVLHRGTAPCPKTPWPVAKPLPIALCEARQQSLTRYACRRHGGDGETPGAAEQSEQVLQHRGLPGGTHAGPGEPRAGLLRVRGSSVSSYGLSLTMLCTLKLRHRDGTGLRSDYGHETIDALPLTWGDPMPVPSRAYKRRCFAGKAAQGSAVLPEGKCM